MKNGGKGCGIPDYIEKYRLKVLLYSKIIDCTLFFHGNCIWILKTKEFS
jgi:hypothetical protein